ncbi:hypothetical protein [Methylocystis sp. MJC1]|uniref:hypothetical protein n=1 Tax=Methylocystis sp. MJC1 TaxID=2654282 RepID=UPI001C1E0C36|nr:hypothetical protein [Methylocystis sp. MJC1]
MQEQKRIILSLRLSRLRQAKEGFWQLGFRQIGAVFQDLPLPGASIPFLQIVEAKRKGMTPRVDMLDVRLGPWRAPRLVGVAQAEKFF